MTTGTAPKPSADLSNSEKKMPVGKILLIAGLVLSLLMALVIGRGVYWWSENKDQVLGHFMEGGREGIDFGKSTDNEGCLAESLHRHDTCGTFPCHLRNNLFLFGCLEESIATPGFCHDVPAKTEFAKTVTWRVSKCFETGREGSYCPQLFGTLQRFCGTRS
jgi:hypothetical protein